MNMLATVARLKQPGTELVGETSEQFAKLIGKETKL
jgi:hypothetical protein